MLCYVIILCYFHETQFHCVARHQLLAWHILSSTIYDWKLKNNLLDINSPELSWTPLFTIYIHCLSYSGSHCKRINIRVFPKLKITGSLCQREIDFYNVTHWIIKKVMSLSPIIQKSIDNCEIFHFHKNLFLIIKRTTWQNVTKKNSITTSKIYNPLTSSHEASLKQNDDNTYLHSGETDYHHSD